MENIKNYIEEIVNLIKTKEENELIILLEEYHENDIANALEFLTIQERSKLYNIFDIEKISEIFAYLDDASTYFEEVGLITTAEIIENMDADDAVDILENLDEDISEKVVGLLDEDITKDIKLIQSYEDDEIGSKMTTNFILIKKTLSIKQAMRELILQAEENDNIYTIYVSNEDETFYGALDIKDLISARNYMKLDDFVSTNYPFVKDKEKVSDCIDRIREYKETSIPVLNDKGKILGVITAFDIVEEVSEELEEDYAKFAGLTESEDLNETLLDSMKKRLPWLIVLLFLGIGVSTIVGLFETVVSEIAIIVCFQSLILGMAGNVGTQSLAVTIRVLMDENLKTKEKLKLVFKEMKVGFCNGFLLGIISFIFIGLYIFIIKNEELLFSFAVSGCVGISLLIAMLISSCVGTLVPIMFNKLKIDPAVASGPLITTINDLVAVISYYGLAWILLINILKL